IELIKKRISEREEIFLKEIKRGIFENKKSPYLKLLKLSHLGYRDIQRLISRNGIEETLKILKEEGVYLTLKEFKGKEPVIRKGKRFLFKESDFDNPVLYEGLLLRSGATRSSGTRITIDFSHLLQIATYRRLIGNIWGLLNKPHIIFHPIFPTGAGIKAFICLQKNKVPFKKWISPIDERNSGISWKGKFVVFLITNLGRFYGLKLPQSEHISFKNILHVVKYIANLLEYTGSCCVNCSVSSAVRICLEAKERGIGIKGTIFRASGEPFTSKKSEIINSVGAKLILHYTFSEVGIVGSLCPRGSFYDDVHFFKDSFALITHRRRVMDFSVDAFLFTSLLPSTPKILLNVENGDYGTIETRKCGCFYDDLGFYDHIYKIRSFEKLTGESMTFYGTELIKICEEILPTKFGGSSLDYQLVEEEDDTGLIRLNILVSPDVGQIDENKLIKTVLEELKRGKDSDKIMAKVWGEANTIRVKRDYPILTKGGKLYPLHIKSKR
ncbi:MAG: hypothetical protein J7K71_01255, partial [Candidatus Omnitrophica bacterium]|nr:hypothetical protein [Candidatus Omnitrophota bacterium]